MARSGAGAVGRRRILLPTAALLLSACQATAAVEGTEIVLTNFALAGPLTLDAGANTLLLRNDSPVVHEVVVIQGVDTFEELPRTVDGQRLDEEAAGIVVVAADEFIAGGATDALVADLRVGTVWFVCNIEGHFLGGMVASAQVAA